jgi:hypothetical protein
MGFGITRPAADNLAGVLDEDIARKTALLASTAETLVQFARTFPLVYEEVTFSL